MPVGLVEIMVLVVVAALWAALVALLFVGIRTVVRRLAGPSKRLEGELGVDVLKARLARGEISEAEFEEGQRLLGVR
jgi:uncharacterized membrane protein